MKALVLSGGGVKGAYQAGALKYILSQGTNYDIFTGCSVGAINAAFLAQFEEGDEPDAGNGLYQLWQHIGAKSIYTPWAYGTLGLLPALWKGSLYSSDPLRKLLTKTVKPACLKTSGKRLVVTAVSETTEETGVWHESDADILDGVMASAAFPGVLPAVAARGDMWMDGGVRENTPLANAIHAGATDIDIICCSPLVPNTPRADLVSRVAHTMEKLLNEAERADIDAAARNNLLVSRGLTPDKRIVRLRVLRPEIHVASNSFDFRPEVIERLLDLGYRDAVNWLEA
jgi:NTE family protein